MSKETIINGVDVSGCGFLDTNRQTKLLLCNECNSDFEAMECKDYHDCYYKQLKRLESENTKLKGSNESLIRQFSAKKLISGTEALFDITTAEFNYQIQRLKEENKKLKQALKKINSIIDNDFINRYMELSFNEYDDILEQIEKICEVLKDE